MTEWQTCQSWVQRPSSLGLCRGQDRSAKQTARWPKTAKITEKFFLKIFHVHVEFIEPTLNGKLDGKRLELRTYKNWELAAASQNMETRMPANDREFPKNLFMVILNKMIKSAKYFLNPISPEGDRLFPINRGLYFLPSGNFFKQSPSQKAQGPRRIFLHQSRYTRHFLVWKKRLRISYYQS